MERAKRFPTKEKIDRQMTGQSSTPFMKLPDKKRKSVTFDAKGALEKTSENMERMNRKTCLISLRFIKEVEDRIGDSLVEEIIGEVIGLSVEIIMEVIEDMNMVEVIFREEIFEEEVTFEVDIMIIIEWIGIEKIGEYGDNLGQEKEIEIDEVRHHLVLDRHQGLVQIEIRLDVSNVESVTTLPMNVLIWFLIIQIGKVTVQGQYHCIWQIVIQDLICSNI